jgi:hypothetical protein
MSALKAAANERAAGLVATIAVIRHGISTPFCLHDDFDERAEAQGLLQQLQAEL